MGFLDPVVKWFIRKIERQGGLGVGKVIELDEDEVAREISQDLSAAENMIDEAFGTLFDALEDDVVNQILSEGELIPGNVETAINGAEGAAIEDSISAMIGSLGVELAGASQIETHQHIITQVLSFMALEDVLGRRLGMVYEKGVDPALEARIAKQTRSEFVAMPDAVEFALRKKQGDRGWLGGENTPDVVKDVVGSNNPVNPNNILEEWGLRDDQRQLLEETGLEAVEAEELLESPIQFGVIPDPEVVERNARRAGLPENVIDLFVDVVENADRSADIWEQRTSTEELVNQLDSLTASGEISPQDAVNLLPSEVEPAFPALRDRFERLAELPSKSPTRSQVESAFGLGMIGRGRFEELLGRVDVDPSEYPEIVGATILDELDGDLYEAVGARTLSDEEYVNLAESVGVDQFAIELLLTGESLSKVAEARVQDEQEATGQRLQTIIGIGQSRASALEGVGIDSVQALANADVDTVAESAVVEPETAQRFIQSARQRIQ